MHYPEEVEPSAMQPPQSNDVDYSKTTVTAPSMSFITGSFLTTTTLVNRNVENLESRMNTCDSIYKLASETNEIREKERIDRLRHLEHFLMDLDKRIDHIDKFIETIQKNAKEQATKYINTNSKYVEIENIIKTFTEDMNEKLDSVVKAINDNDIYVEKTIKKIKEEIKGYTLIEGNNEVVSSLREGIREISARNREMEAIVLKLKVDMA